VFARSIFPIQSNDDKTKTADFLLEHIVVVKGKIMNRLLPRRAFYSTVLAFFVLRNYRLIPIQKAKRPIGREDSTAIATEEETNDASIEAWTTTRVGDKQSGEENSNDSTTNTSTSTSTATSTSTSTKTAPTVNNATSVSEAWVLAMQQAEEMLLAKDTVGDVEFDRWKASCLVPNTRGTEELVRRLVSEKQEKENREEDSAVHLPTTITRLLSNKAFEDPLVPLPILNVGMPKVGSTSLYYYFECKGLAATHWNLGTEKFEGLCMRDAVKVGLPPLETCTSSDNSGNSNSNSSNSGNTTQTKTHKYKQKQYTHAIMQMDVALPLGSRYGNPKAAFRSSVEKDDCFFPQLSLLEEFHAENPHATFVMTFRPMQDWVKSMVNWFSMLERLQQCHLPNLPRGIPSLSEHKSETETQNYLEATMTQFFCSHVLHVRNFVRDHPTHNLIELDLYDERTPYLLDRLFPSSLQLTSPSDASTATNNGTTANGTGAALESSCWGQHNGGVKGRPMNWTRYQEKNIRKQQKAKRKKRQKRK